MDLKKHIRSIPDYPKKGILFRDITTLIKSAEAFKFTNDKIIEISKLLYNLFLMNEIINANIKVIKIKYPINPLSEIISE